MDDLNCCLSQIIHLCTEACIFLNQLSKFEYQYEEFVRLNKISLEKSFQILNHFSLVLNDLNFYYKNNFLQLYSNTLNYLSKKSFTIDHSNKIIEKFSEDLNQLNSFLNHQENSYKHLYNSIHKLTITCSLCLQYRQFCTYNELTNRFIYVRLDLLMNLRKLNDEIKCLLKEINRNFKKRKEYSLQPSKDKIEITNLSRTICLWLCLFMIICYFFWPIVSETKSKTGYPM